jgi:hypothetical protein
MVGLFWSNYSDSGDTLWSLKGVLLNEGEGFYERPEGLKEKNKWIQVQ